MSERDQGINPHGVEEADVFAAHQEGGQTCIQVFFFRTGQNWGNRAYFPRADKSRAWRRCWSRFIAQFYDDKPAPKLHPALARDRRAGVACRGAVASRRGARSSRACRSAARSATSSRMRCQRPRGARPQAGRGLLARRRCSRRCGERFGLDETPERIEVYDNSHIQGTNAVGAMIVAGAGRLREEPIPQVQHQIRELTPGDDYAMMREVLTRRFTRLVLDEAEAPSPRREGSGGASHRGEAELCASMQRAPQPPPIDRRGGSALSPRHARSMTRDSPQPEPPSEAEPPSLDSSDVERPPGDADERGIPRPARTWC